MNVIIYGAGGGSGIILDMCRSEGMKVLFFSDSDERLWGMELEGVSVISPSDISRYNFDKIVIGSITYRREIIETLTNDLNIDSSNIDDRFVAQMDSDALYSENNNNNNNRVSWLRQYAKIVSDSNLTDGNVAEVGVFRGAFAKEMNACFSDRTLYLFDTFKGFDGRDVDDNTLERKVNYLTTGVDMVRSILPHPEKAVFKVGYFPETASDMNDRFIFVNLDCNVYQPTLEGLNFFWPRMVSGGVILVHDYICRYPQVWQAMRRAVNEFSQNQQVRYIPIGDVMSVAFVKS
jgi:O-methyltransferase